MSFSSRLFFRHKKNGMPLFSIRMGLSLSPLFFLILGLFLGVIFFSPILFPFFMGFFWAYAWQPVLTIFHQKWGLSKSFGSFLVLLFTYSLLFLIGFTFISALSLVYEVITEHWLQVRDQIHHGLLPILKKFSKADFDWQQYIHLVLNYGALGMGSMLSYFWHNGWGVGKFFTNLLIFPAISFYFMKDWTLIWERFFALFPRSHRCLAMRFSKESNLALSKYLRGQMVISALLIGYYTTSLSACGFSYSLHLGILTGLSIWLPYLGFFIALLGASIAGLVQFGEPESLLWILGIYGFGCAVEGMILTPHFIGQRTGLHPLWVLFAVFAGGFLKGLLGVIIALPLATVLAVAWRSFRYSCKQSSLDQHQEICQRKK